MSPPAETAVKQQQFNAAMALFEARPVYRRIGRVTSVANLTLQVALLVLALRHPIGWLSHLFALAAAYVFADFVNGLVHLYMDRNDDYASAAGPLVAAFHLHHKTPLYKQTPLLVVYFNETGSKLWLVPCLLAGVLVTTLVSVHPVVAYLLAYFGILSSVAEVAHYRCHMPDSRAAELLGGYGLLLSKRHHVRHHLQDNVSYAFLSGLTDPLIDLIARHASTGYQQTTDLHYAQYTGKGTENRGQ